MDRRFEARKRELLKDCEASHPPLNPPHTKPAEEVPWFVAAPAAPAAEAVPTTAGPGETPWFTAAPAPAPAPAPVAIPAVPVGLPDAAPPEPAVGEKTRPALVSSLLSLPKPILFGLFGGVGGLLGALLIGEVVWLILSPSGLAPRGPEVRVAIPDSLRIYPGGSNRFLVKIARQGFEGPVTVEALAHAEEVAVRPVRIGPGEDEAEVEVRIPEKLPSASIRSPSRSAPSSTGRSPPFQPPSSCTSSRCRPASP
jgi:hypothetical protein